MAAQTSRPDLSVWSTTTKQHGTAARWRSSAELPFLRVMATPPALNRGPWRRRTVAAARGPLTGREQLPRDRNTSQARRRYECRRTIRAAVAEFEIDPDPASRRHLDRTRRPRAGPGARPGHEDPPSAALKLYSRACLEAIARRAGALGAGTESQASSAHARLPDHSFEVSRPETTALRQRDGRLRGRARGGETTTSRFTAWILPQSGRGRLAPFLVWELVSLRLLSAAARSTPRVGDRDYGASCAERLRLRGRQRCGPPAQS